MTHLASLKPAIATIDDAGETIFSRDLDGRLIQVDPLTAADFDKEITLIIDGRPVTVRKAVPARDAQGNILRDEHGLAIPRAVTIYDAATQLYADTEEGNPIPILCHREHMAPAAVCRLCVVEIAKVKRGKRQTERKLLPACQHRVEETMEVQTIESPNDPAARERIRSAVGMLVELLMSDHPSPCAKEKSTGDCELEAIARRLDVGEPRFDRRSADRGKDETSPVIAVDHDACILCDRCVRGCNDVKGNHVLGRMGKGYQAKIAFDFGDSMGESSCVSCGECMISCPTGALTHRHAIPADPWKGVEPTPQAVEMSELLDHPVATIRRAFEGLSPSFLRWNSGSIVRRRFRKGEVIYKQGTFDSTAFLIERGRVALENGRHEDAEGLVKGIGGVLGGFLAAWGKKPAQADRGPVAEVLGPGDLFGESTCLNYYPHPETARAAEDCTVIEVLRNVLHAMMRGPEFRRRLERDYRARAIAHHLRTVPLFATIASDGRALDELTEWLRPRVSLRRCEPGELIDGPGRGGFQGLTIVRTGFVKVARGEANGERILTYLGPNQHFGEVRLLAGRPGTGIAADHAAARLSHVALDHVELIRIAADDLNDLLETHGDALLGQLVESARATIREIEGGLGASRNGSLDAFLGQGLMNAQSLLVLDLERCTRCDDCTKACAHAHDGVTRLVREGLRFDKFLVASACRSCLDPYCMVGCPVGSIRRKETREIVIEDWCIGCGLCAENCPYGSINMKEIETGETVPDPNMPGRKMAVIKHKATACDLCRDMGPKAEPSCVYACPHDAAHRMSGADLFSLIERNATRPAREGSSLHLPILS